ncbi:hypothetical protein [Blastochloris tepida]|uniref:Glycosyltransferase RgtA/B/C/D-like domain-containing protein n=1 Tax=Blastochloris tepida TaxID=2233851 RepID=A0A348G2S1_9HYPH|nr:hypothetical protein [Blastochloris tepida]BBF93854.1 hypothetical protein BLTE_25390 [Blastochloris tepida]
MILRYLFVLLLAGWLLYPILFPAPVEGFSAAILSLGAHLANGDLLAFDPLQPFNVEFFSLSKLGAVLGVAGLMESLGVGAETALRLMMWSGEAVLLVSTFVLVRRWSGASPLLAIAAILLVPGMIENSFFYNENVVAAAFAALGLVCFGTPSRVLLPLIGGALFGLGALTRPDIVLAGAAVPLIVFERSGLTRRSAIALLAGALAGAITWFGTLALMGASVLDVLKAAGHAFMLWDRQPAYPRHVRELLFFVGLPAGLLALAGMAALVRQRAFVRLALLVLPIVVVNVVFFGSLWQSRQLLSIAPFVVALTALGLTQLLPQPGMSRPGAWVRGAVAAAIALILLVPGPTAYDDGPRDLFGRIPGIAHWRNWQNDVAADMATIRRAVDDDKPGLRVIITDDWNPDRYVHFALVDAGFRPQPRAGLAPACAGIAEPFVRGPQQVLHLRIHQSFLKDANALNRERFETMARPCLDAVAPGSTTLVLAADRLRFIEGGGDVALLWPAEAKGAFGHLLQRMFTGQAAGLTAVAVDAAMLDRMAAAYVALEAQTRQDFIAKGYTLRTVADGIAGTRRIIPFPRD